jgi:FlaA1/EpsC-like NDP-sugar epimerase
MGLNAFKRILERYKLIGVFENQRVLVLGGTGSLGSALIKVLLNGQYGSPKRVIVFSRDEAKQHEMQVSYLGNLNETDSISYRFAKEKLGFAIGDVRDKNSLLRVVPEADIVIYASAMKHVPACEYFPWQAIQTNIIGVNNVIEVAQRSEVKTLVGVSTDKAVLPLNVMGMTKALQEKLVIQSNLNIGSPRSVVVRYGNVIASRGSVIPLFKHQISRDMPITLTDINMTRFLLTLDDAVSIIVKAINLGLRGETFIPAAPSARMIDLIEILAMEKKIEIVEIGRRPGEKIHELLFSEEEAKRTLKVDDASYRITPALPEFENILIPKEVCQGEFSSADHTLSKEELKEFLRLRQVI